MLIQAKALILLGLVAIVFGGGVGLGWWGKSMAIKAASVDQAKEQAKANTQQAERQSGVVQGHAEAKAKTEIRYVTTVKEVEKLVERPVYLERCLDDDGLRALNEQIVFDADKP